MILYKKAADTHNWIEKERLKKKKIGFVPTMGALHEGHISLIETSKGSNDHTICSIFINPTQFNDPKDFAKYPVSLEKDLQLLEEAGCDFLFLPDVNEMYPDGLAQTNNYKIGRLETLLEGKFRPGHFQGVCQVVHRLLEIILPNNLYIGQKDYQQCLVIKKLLQLIGLDDKIELRICPTLREPDGLAMSSRNLRLNDEERKRAPAIYETLLFIQSQKGKKTTVEIKKQAKAKLEARGFRVDYTEIADAITLETADGWSENKKLVALIAAFNNEVRLIDNLLL
ncbi:MAG TPA: pantoate--beta-alanine ligase [Chitinophagaceae bacterium]|nr:pantoate--beta-alanine ligase [Chitinophagaceae bacterium]